MIPRMQIVRAINCGTENRSFNWITLKRENPIMLDATISGYAIPPR